MKKFSTSTYDTMMINNDNKPRIIRPPESVRGMLELNRDQFRREVSIPYIVASVSNMSTISKQLRKCFLKVDHIKPIQEYGNDQRKILLNPDQSQQFKSIIEELKNQNLLIKPNDIENEVIGHEEMELKYENFNHTAIFRSIFGQNDESSLSGFSTIGHIIHLNLREHMLPFKKLIGQVLLDKIHGCRLVVNKLDIIDNKYRNFAMEILAKDDKDPPVTTVVDTIEHNVRFRFDFADVYWNPRLSYERSQILKKLNHQVDRVYDVFAGVGPFSLTAAKLCKCRCLANDLNPASYRWLLENVKLNKMESLIKCSNLDGREFIHDRIRADLIEQMEQFDGTDMNRHHHVIMNLPAMAIEFLNEFNGLLSSIRVKKYQYQIPFLRIHCYCFLKGSSEEERQSLWSLASQHLNHPISSEDIEELHEVRKVAPNKIMYRLSFRIGKDVLYGLNQNSNNNDDDDDNDINGNDDNSAANNSVKKLKPS